MDELDQFMKHNLRVKKYLRYTDDFVIIAEDLVYLNSLLKPVESFLNDQLKLSLHPEKVIIRKLSQGIDFLGYVVFPYHRILRIRTRKRMWRKIGEKIKQYEDGQIEKEKLDQVMQSYLGILSHGNEYKTSERLKNWVYLSTK